MLKDKVQALLKSLPQRPRSRLVPLPEYGRRASSTDGARASADGCADRRAAASACATQTSLDVQARRLQARHAAAAPVHEPARRRRARPPARHRAQPRRAEGRAGRAGARRRSRRWRRCNVPGVGRSRRRQPRRRRSGAPAQAAPQRDAGRAGAAAPAQRYTAWTFGELPELMEVRQRRAVAGRLSGAGRQRRRSRDRGLRRARVAAAKHRAGLRRLFALQLKDALKYLEKNIPDLQKMAVAYMPLGTRRGAARADRRRRARPRLPAGAAARPTRPRSSAASRKAAAG